MNKSTAEHPLPEATKNHLTATKSGGPGVNAFRRKTAWWLLGCCVLFVGVTLYVNQGNIATLQTWLDQTGAGAPVLFVFVAIILMSVIMPKTLVSISAGALFGTTTGALLVTIIALSAAFLNYFIGRWCLSDWIERRMSSRTSSQSAWPKVLRDLATEGGLGFHLLFRFAPIPSMIVNYSMGAANARFAPFLLGAFIGVLPQLLWVHGGTLANIDQPAELGIWRLVSTSVSIIAAIAVSVLIPREVMRRIEREHAQKTRTPADSADPIKK